MGAPAFSALPHRSSGVSKKPHFHGTRPAIQPTSKTDRSAGLFFGRRAAGFNRMQSGQRENWGRNGETGFGLQPDLARALRNAYQRPGTLLLESRFSYFAV